MSDFLEKARPYAEHLGWAVFPVGRTKQPLVKGGCHAASKDPAQLATWNRQFPSANVAVATGAASGVFVIDVDGPDGERSFARLRLLFPVFDRVPSVATAKGHHYYLKPIGPVKNRASSVLGKGIDVRGDGGSATLPPSVHESGVVYAWIDHPLSLAPKLPPPGLLRMMADPPPPKLGPCRDAPPNIRNVIDRLRQARPGERNHALNAAAFLCGKATACGAVTEAEAVTQLEHAARSIGLLPDEIKPTIRSGFQAGMRAR